MTPAPLPPPPPPRFPRLTDFDRWVKDAEPEDIEEALAALELERMNP